jgi:hypothetical protein
MDKLPCWVDLLRLQPDGEWVEEDVCAGGKTYAEAAAPDSVEQAVASPCVA